MRWTDWAAALAVVCLCAGAGLRAQEPNPYIQPQMNVRQLPVNTGATALWETLLKLHTRASLLMIVAHPDDEDGGMLTYESRGMGVRTGMLTLTRGEGGQNVMTGDFNDALGLIRTQELLKADEYLDVDQMWGSVADFGFSKTMDETLANWGYDRVLCDAVRAVRVYRPLVVTSVFIGGVTDGHGHHQVAGRLAQEVFNAAGDASVCADQITKEGLQPWQPLKVYARVPSYSISPKGIYDYATGKYAPAKFYNYIDKTWSGATPATNVTIPEGTYSPLLGMSYLQFARIGLGEQKTQNGGGAMPVAGAFDVAYHRYGSRVDASVDEEQGFFDGVDTSLMGIAALAPDDNELPKELAAIDADVTQAMREYSVTDTAKIAPVLADGLKQTTAVLDRLDASSLPDHEKYDARQELLRKQAQFNDALVDALGLSIRVQVTSTATATGAISRVQESADTLLAVTPAEGIHVNLQVGHPSTIPASSIQLDGLRAPGDVYNHYCSYFCYAQPPGPGADHGEYSASMEGFITRPYFTRPNIEQPYYDIANPQLRGQSGAPYLWAGWAKVPYDGVSIILGEVVQTQHRAVGQGMVYQPLTAVPAVSVALAPAAGIIPLDAKTIKLAVQIRNDAVSSAGTLKLKLPAGWTSEPASAEYNLTRRGEVSNVEFTVTPSNLGTQSYTISAVAVSSEKISPSVTTISANGEHNDSEFKQYTEGYTTVGYAGLTPTNLYRDATYKSSGVDVQVAPGLRVAYLAGTGDDVPQSLMALGVNVHVLTVEEVATADPVGLLQQYDEIVLGVRAYNAHPELAGLTAKLDSYADAGGVVVVQYNTSPFASTVEHSIAPYPFALGGMVENVVEEKAPVSLLLPAHPLLSWPNKITSADFDGWVEERGHSFMGTWNAHYEALTETHDDGQDPQRGGLLVAHVGCGAYVYVAYALYRQLPEGVPGAYRIFANLLSLPKKMSAGDCRSRF